MTSRAKTKEEVREEFLGVVRAYVGYWERESRAVTSKEKLEGLAFSFLCLLDGVNAGFPAVDLAVSPHPDDKQYHIDNDEYYYEPGMVFNDDVMLHDMLHK